MKVGPRRIVWGMLRLFAVVAGLLGITACVNRQSVIGRNAASLTQVSPDRLRSHVEFLCVECRPRHYLARENQAKVRQYIEARFREAGARTERQKYSTPSGEHENVIARFGPDAGPRYIIGAHYDVCGAEPGADDNASGVAGLIELAALLGAEKSLPVAFELVAYDLEEPPFFAGPFMGSAVHARRLKEQNANVALMLSLEMIGYFKDTHGSQTYPLPLMGLMYPTTANFIAIVGRWDQRKVVSRFKRASIGAASIPVVSIAAPGFVPAIDFSDHRNYWAEGYPALLITDTSFLRNPHYHQSTDTPDMLDYRRMAEVIRTVHAGLLNHAQANRIR